MEKMKTTHATPSRNQDVLGPLKPMFAMREAPLHSRCSNPNHPCPVHRPWVGRTPPVTSPGRTTPLCSLAVAAKAATGGSCYTSEPKLTGVAAPASAVDEVEEMFGRPRAHSLSRNVRHMSLLEWDEGDDEEMLDSLAMEDRRRAVSMSAAETLRQRRSSTMEAFSLRKRCHDCNLAPSFAMKGEPPSYCRAHQMAGMVNVLLDRCNVLRCSKMANYGFPGEGKQRCFSHMEKDMVHVLGAAMKESRGDNGTTRDAEMYLGR